MKIFVICILHCLLYRWIYFIISKIIISFIPSEKLLVLLNISFLQQNYRRNIAMVSNEMLSRCHSFKHNTSFVSRLSTIRRHRPPFTHSPMTRSRGADVNTSSDNLSGRIRPSVSEDSVSKDFSEASKRNSDGKVTLTIIVFI